MYHTLSKADSLSLSLNLICVNSLDLSYLVWFLYCHLVICIDPEIFFQEGEGGQEVQRVIVFFHVVWGIFAIILQCKIFLPSRSAHVFIHMTLHGQCIFLVTNIHVFAMHMFPQLIDFLKFLFQPNMDFCYHLATWVLRVDSCGFNSWGYPVFPTHIFPVFYRLFNKKNNLIMHKHDG